MTKMDTPSLKRYIKETYKKLGEINYSNYWNLGYINALIDNKIIDIFKGAGLFGYNDRIYFIEEMKIIKRRWTKMIELGDKVKDTVTGLEGMVVAKIIYMNGCIQYEIQPKGLKDGKIIKSAWIDEGQLIIKSRAKMQEEKKELPGGSGHIPSEFSHPD